MTAHTTLVYAVTAILTAHLYTGHTCLGNPTGEDRPSDPAGAVNQDYMQLQAMLGKRLSGSIKEKEKTVDLLLQLLEEIDLPRLCAIIANDTNFRKSDNDFKQTTSTANQLNPRLTTSTESTMDKYPSGHSSEEKERVKGSEEEEKDTSVESGESIKKENGGVESVDNNEKEKIAKSEQMNGGVATSKTSDEKNKITYPFLGMRRPLRRGNLLPFLKFHRRVNSDGRLSLPRMSRHLARGDRRNWKNAPLPYSKIHGLTMQPSMMNTLYPLKKDKKMNEYNFSKLFNANFNRPRSYPYSRRLVLGEGLKRMGNNNIAIDKSIHQTDIKTLNSKGKEEEKGHIKAKTDDLRKKAGEKKTRRQRGKIVRRIIYRKRKPGKGVDRRPVRYKIVRRVTPYSKTRRGSGPLAGKGDNKNRRQMMHLKRKAMRERFYRAKMVKPFATKYRAFNLAGRKDANEIDDNQSLMHQSSREMEFDGKDKYRDLSENEGISMKTISSTTLSTYSFPDISTPTETIASSTHMEHISENTTGMNEGKETESEILHNDVSKPSETSEIKSLSDNQQFQVIDETLNENGETEMVGTSDRIDLSGPTVSQEYLENMVDPYRASYTVPPRIRKIKEMTKYMHGDKDTTVTGEGNTDHLESEIQKEINDDFSMTTTLSSEKTTVIQESIEPHHSPDNVQFYEKEDLRPTSNTVETDTFEMPAAATSEGVLDLETTQITSTTPQQDTVIEYQDTSTSISNDAPVITSFKSDSPRNTTFITSQDESINETQTTKKTLTTPTESNLPTTVNGSTMSEAIEIKRIITHSQNGTKERISMVAESRVIDMKDLNTNSYYSKMSLEESSGIAKENANNRTEDPNVVKITPGNEVFKSETYIKKYTPADEASKEFSTTNIPIEITTTLVSSSTETSTPIMSSLKTSNVFKSTHDTTTEATDITSEVNPTHFNIRGTEMGSVEDVTIDTTTKMTPWDLTTEINKETQFVDAQTTRRTLSENAMMEKDEATRQVIHDVNDESNTINATRQAMYDSIDESIAINTTHQAIHDDNDESNNITTTHQAILDDNDESNTINTTHQAIYDSIDESITINATHQAILDVNDESNTINTTSQAIVDGNEESNTIRNNTAQTLSVASTSDYNKISDEQTILNEENSTAIDYSFTETMPVDESRVREQNDEEESLSSLSSLLVNDDVKETQKKAVANGISDANKMEPTITATSPNTASASNEEYYDTIRAEIDNHHYYNEDLLTTASSDTMNNPPLTDAFSVSLESNGTNSKNISNTSSVSIPEHDIAVIEQQDKTPSYDIADFSTSTNAENGPVTTEGTFPRMTNISTEDITSSTTSSPEGNKTLSTSVPYIRFTMNETSNYDHSNQNTLEGLALTLSTTDKVNGENASSEEKKSTVGKTDVVFASDDDIHQSSPSMNFSQTSFQSSVTDVPVNGDVSSKSNHTFRNASKNNYLFRGNTSLHSSDQNANLSFPLASNPTGDHVNEREESSSEEIEQSIAQAEGSQEQIEQDIASIVDSQEEIEQSITQAEESHEQIEQNITQAEGSQEGIEQSIPQTEGSQEQIEQSIAPTEESQEEIEQGIASIIDSQEEIEQSIAKTEESQDSRIGNDLLSFNLNEPTLISPTHEGHTTYQEFSLSTEGPTNEPMSAVTEGTHHNTMTTEINGNQITTTEGENETIMHASTASSHEEMNDTHLSIEEEGGEDGGYITSEESEEIGSKVVAPVDSTSKEVDNSQNVESGSDYGVTDADDTTTQGVEDEQKSENDIDTLDNADADNDRSNEDRPHFDWANWKNLKISGREQLARIHGMGNAGKPRTSAYNNNKLGSKGLNGINKSYRRPAKGEQSIPARSKTIDLWKAYNIAVSSKKGNRNGLYTGRPYRNQMWNSMPWIRPASSSRRTYNDYKPTYNNYKGSRFSGGVPAVYTGASNTRRGNAVRPAYGYNTNPYNYDRSMENHERYWGNRFSQGFYGRALDNNRFDARGSFQNNMDGQGLAPERITYRQKNRTGSDENVESSADYVKPSQVIINNNGPNGGMAEEDLRKMIDQRRHLSDVTYRSQTGGGLRQPNNYHHVETGPAGYDSGDSNNIEMGEGANIESTYTSAGDLQLGIGSGPQLNQDITGPVGIPAPGDYRCPGLFGYHRDPNDCQAFFICSWGIPYRLYCGAGTLFNSEQSVCDWAVNVDCSRDTSAA